MAVINATAQLSGTAGATVVTTYTCPAGVTAVVHVYITSDGTLPAVAKLNNVTNTAVGSFLRAAVGTNYVPNASASLTLEPGDTLALFAPAGSISAELSMAVTGYEVP